MIGPKLTLEHVSYAYGAQSALQDVSGQFLPGSLTALTGPNGAGKSTLLQIIAGLLKPQKGRVSCSFSQGAVGYMPQTSTVRRDYPLHVLKAVYTGFWPQAGAHHAITPTLKQRALEALHEVGLEGFEKRPLSALSGGQFQRLLFARLIVQDPALILLDEPFSGIDTKTTAQLMERLLAWHRQGRTILCVLHDPLVIRRYFPEAFVLCHHCIGKGLTHDLLEQKILFSDFETRISA
ncbi:MAG: ABC transporter ATP-binding protein [Alphaproteobacteria bacterium]|nr:ABC transporter ATP-binding protein [Alphaproteobacteria bacterium]